jgi:class 3 adenylate cyclase
VDAPETVERRIVTVLFADLVGFTTLSESYDPEDLAAIQDAYFAMVRETVSRYGGRLEKFIGDAAMAVFGVPRSRDDDASRAVRAGLALVHGVQQIGAQIGLEDGALRVRVGVNTGETVIAASGEDEGRVTGDTVNTAARLQTAAPPGGVLIGETTALAVADFADMQPVPPLELKGKAEPTPARLVNGIRAEASREQAMGALRAPTLGRDRELEMLLDASRRTSEGRVERWLIIAPPGVGKSRLLRELEIRIGAAPKGSATWHSRARPESVSPFDPVARLLLDALGTADQATAKQRLLDALGDAGTSAERAQVVADACMSVVWPPVSTSAADTGKPADERDTLFASWLEGLDALSGGATQVWLVEDVHWAGGDVLAFLDFCTSRSRAAGKGGRLIVATARPSLLESSADWAAADEGARHMLMLTALERTDAQALVTALVGDALPAALVERICERSDGNCLFIEELLRTWVSVGTLSADGRGGWRLAVPTEEIPLPASVQSIYAAQLDDLPPDARQLARRASVAGRRFPIGALEPLGARPRQGLESLKRRELIIGPLTEPLWGEAFAYRHALLRDAGYASLARAERARLHVRLAKWLEQAAGERSGEIAEQIATHYSSAVDSAPALAREIDDGLDRDAVRRLAADWYERAGQGTLSLSAHDAARQLFRRSIDLTSDEASLEKARRWERLGDATAFAADMDEGAAAYQKAMDFYRTSIDKGLAGFDVGSKALTSASQRMAAGAEWLAKISPEGAKALVEGAASLSQGSDELQAGKRELAAELGAARSGLARTTASLADVMYQQLKFAESTQLADQVIGELGDADPASAVRLMLAKARGSLGAGGPSPEAERLFERALELSDQASDPAVQLEAQAGLTLLRSESGRGNAQDWRRVEEMALKVGNWKEAIGAATNATMYSLDDSAADVFEPIDHSRQTAAVHGLTEETGWLDYLESEAAFVSGDWDRARFVGNRAVALGEANAYLRMTVRTWHVLIPIASVTGDRDTLARAARWYRSLEGKFEFPDSPYSRVIRTAQDLEMAAAGLWPAFVPDVEPRIASFDDDPSGPSWSAALDRILRAWIDAGELDGAARALESMDGAIGRMAHVTSLGLGTYDLMRGRVALARGEPTIAAHAARSALDRYRASNAPWWTAKAIRLLERTGLADSDMIVEVERIERHLGAISPTA